MFKKIMLLAVLPTLLLAQPTEARRLFWWQMVNPDGTAVSPNVYDENDVPQNVYGPDPYAQQDEQFNQDQYQLYEREMARRYHRHAYAAPNYADPTPPSPYAAPIYPSKPKRKLVNRIIHPKPMATKPLSTVAVAPQPAPPVATASPLTTASPVATASPVTTASPVPTAPPAATASPIAPTPKLSAVKKSGAVTCEKGATIVSSFGFEGVSTKSCDGTTLVYNASRGGKPFEINVSASNGELTAVKKL